MKRFHLLLIAVFAMAAFTSTAQVTEKIYEITIITLDSDGDEVIKELVVEGENMEQDELDELIQDQLNGYEGELDVTVNISDVSEEIEKSTKTITKIIKQRNNSFEEEKIIIDETGMEIEVIDDKVFIDGEEVKDGDYGDKKIRILKFGEGEDVEIENILKGEDIEIGEGEKIYYIEREESNEGLAFLGIYPAGRSVNGVQIGKVIDGSSAQKMGLQVGDLIKAIDGKAVTTFNSLSKIIKSYLPGETVKISYERAGQLNDVKVGLSDYDEFNDHDGRARMKRRGNALSQKRHRHAGRKHKKTDPNRPTLGVVISSVNENEILIDEVLAGSAAEKAGLLKGDKIIKMDKAKLLNQDQFIATIKAHKIGDEIKLKILRDGKKKTIRAVLQAPKQRRDKFSNNKSNRVERIIIKDKNANNSADLETGGAIRIRNFDLSPNPSKGDINVVFELDKPKQGEEVTMRIISVGGKIVKENFIDLRSGNFKAAFDLSEYPSGVYLFQVEKNKQTFTKRFVLNKD